MRNTTNYLSLPFNPKLRERAKALRKAGNLSEVLLWQQLRKRKFRNLDFDRQKIIGNYIVDFYCVSCQAVIEVDGSSHDEKHEYDQERDAFLEGLGLSVIHISAVDVLNRLEEVMLMLDEHPALRVDLSPLTTPSGFACHPSTGGELPRRFAPPRQASPVHPSTE